VQVPQEVMETRLAAVAEFRDSVAVLAQARAHLLIRLGDAGVWIGLRGSWRGVEIGAAGAA